MSKIIVYSREAFEGRSAEFNDDVRDLEEEGFTDAIASIKVIGKPWVVYYDNNFDGKQRLIEEGEYATIKDIGQFSSLKMITIDRAYPEIQLFEHINYKGRSVTLRKETNLHSIDFSDIASSHKVKSGVWVLYERTNRQGSQLISFPGHQVPNYVRLSFNDVASCVRPLQPRP